MSQILLQLLVIAGLIGLNGLFVATEFAVVAASRTRLAQMAEQGSRAAARVLSIISDRAWQTRFLILAQIGITLASLGLGMYGEHTIAEWILAPLEERTPLSKALAHSIASALAIGIMTYMHVVLGEVLPKSLALQKPEPLALALVGPMAWLERLLSPIISVLNALARGIMRLFGIPEVDVHTRLLSAEELEIIVEESAEGGLIQGVEQLFLENIFDLSERTVGQVMTPRTKIVGIPMDADESQVLERVCTTRHTRYPIYDQDLDHIRGILHVKDLARYLVHREGPFDLRRFAELRPPVFVPETVSLEDMLERFRQEEIAMAVVVDEFGGTAGVVTVEDLLEEVVGEIQDEFDQESPPIEVVDERTLRVQGGLLLDELEQHYGVQLDCPDVDTVGGLIMALLGRIPRPGDQVEWQGVRFVVETVDGRAVGTARVILPAPLREPGDGESQEELGQA